jgi:hypothetical protein
LNIELKYSFQKIFKKKVFFQKTKVRLTTAEQRAAGCVRAATAYHDAAYLFPRFERQKMRAFQDLNIIEGEV